MATHKLKVMDWHVGCSGFHYKHWKGTFYPEGLAQKHWFEYYASQFTTLELNVTFYRFPTVPILQNWYNNAPPGFRFAVKAPKAITHFKQFHGTVDMVSSFYDTIREGLKEKLGPVLFQFPPRFRYDKERLARVIAQLDPAFENVLEFRHPAWWCDEVYRELRNNNIAFCGMSYPGLPDQVVITGKTLYYRFHGVPELYRSAYTDAELQQFACELASATAVEDVWCYFNNDVAVAAIPNAHALSAMAASL